MFALLWCFSEWAKHSSHTGFFAQNVACDTDWLHEDAGVIGSPELSVSIMPADPLLLRQTARDCMRSEHCLCLRGQLMAAD